MSNPNSGSGTQTSRMPHPWHGWWRRSARLALAVLACTFASAVQAQERYDNLDHAVNSIIREIVEDGNLRGQRVSVGADDFFEEETGFYLRPRLSEMLRAKCRTAFTRNGVGNLEMVESEDAWVLHGRWWRETRESREYLHLRLFIARPVQGDTPPQEGEGEAGLVPITGVIRDVVKPTLLHWGGSVVRQLERDLPGTGSRNYRLHRRPFEVHGATQPERLGRHLRNRWLRAFTGSRRFGLVDSTGFDGELFGEVSVTDEHVEVDLYVQDSQGGQVAAAFVTPDKELFPPDFFGPDVTAELAKCAGLVDAGNLEGAKECYEGVRAVAPGDAAAVEGVRAGLERIEIERVRAERAREEAAAVRGVEEAIGRGELGEAKEELKRLRELNAGHPRLGELEGKIAATYQGFIGANRAEYHQDMSVQEMSKKTRGTLRILTSTATTDRNVEDFFRTNNIHNGQAHYIESITHDEVIAYLYQGVFDLYSADISTLEAILATAPRDFRFYPQRICCIPQ